MFEKFKQKGKQFLESKLGYSIADLAPLAVVFVILGIVISMGALILTKMNESATVTGTANTVLSNAISALKDFSSWFAILVIIIIAAIIIGIVMRYFGNLGGKGV